MTVLRVGIIGQGRSGRNIHGNALNEMGDKYVIKAIADGLEDRRVRAKNEFGCNTYATYEEMIENEELDLIVNASPSHLHFPISLNLLNKGLHVLCEKPLAGTCEEVDQLIAASETNNCIIAVFQQSRYMPAFMKMREVIDSGILGKIIQIDFTNNQFARRWDWQTLQSNNGGNLYNTGPHPIDQALQLFGSDEMPQMMCMMERVNTFGDAEDYVKIIMRGPGRPTIDLEISSCSAFPRANFTVQGAWGGLTVSGNGLKWKYFKPEEAPEQQLISTPMIDAKGDPAYCNESLTWYEDSWEYIPSEYAGNTQSLYNMLYNTLTAGTPLEVTPQQVRQQIAVLDECRRQNPHIYK